MDIITDFCLHTGDSNLCMVLSDRDTNPPSQFVMSCVTDSRVELDEFVKELVDNLHGERGTLRIFRRGDLVRRLFVSFGSDHCTIEANVHVVQ